MIAIHPRLGSFTDRWISWCDENGIAYRLVDCYRSDIIQQLEGCNGLMWHWAHYDHKASLFARQLTMSLERAGIRVFPDTETSWHYDDKVGQKYLLEAIGLPFVPTYIFYDRNVALSWAAQTIYPKVFKLSGGAGSENVKLVRNVDQANRFIRRSFGRGWNLKSRLHPLKERLWHFRRDRNLRSLWNIWRGVARLVIPTADERVGRIERHYAYFQEFIPDNDHDIRVVVIGRRAFALKRMVRDGDFRASGSGHTSQEPTVIPKECIDIAFAASRKLGTQCTAYDFVFVKGRPLIVEISYAFVTREFEGWWDETATWHHERLRVEDCIAEEFICSIQRADGGTA